MTKPHMIKEIHLQGNALAKRQKLRYGLKNTSYNYFKINSIDKIC